jgi:hypothetical protein
MAQTFSQSLTGVDANARYNTAKSIQVGDTDRGGDNLTTAASQAGNMSDGDQVLCKNPDGSQSYYRIDAERSIPGVSLVMIKV